MLSFLLLHASWVPCSDKQLDGWGQPSEVRYGAQDEPVSISVCFGSDTKFQQ